MRREREWMKITERERRRSETGERKKIGGYHARNGVWDFFVLQCIVKNLHKYSRELLGAMWLIWCI